MPDPSVPASAIACISDLSRLVTHEPQLSVSYPYVRLHHAIRDLLVELVICGPEASVSSMQGRCVCQHFGKRFRELEEEAHAQDPEYVAASAPATPAADNTALAAPEVVAPQG